MDCSNGEPGCSGDISIDELSSKVAPGMTYTPGPGAYDVTPSWNGKVWKEILREGTGTETPADGVTVFVHYVGRLGRDGPEFDKSDQSAGGKAFSFNLGKREVIQGWEIGVSSMKKGELALIIIHPELGYGERGSGPKIPPNATLWFTIELLDWTLEDLSGGDGGVQRKVIKAGELKNYHPNDGASCTIHIKGSYNSRIFEDRTVSFVLGEGSEVGLIPGIELALPKFTEHEKSELIIGPAYAYGNQEKTFQMEDGSSITIPPGSTLNYTIELLSFTKGKEAWSLDGPQKLVCAREFKSQGTKYFQQKKYYLAHRNYKKIVDFLKAEALLEGEAEEERKALLGAGYLNQAQCSLELRNYLDAKHCAEEGLLLQPNSVKGYYRLGLANLGLCEPKSAKKAFEKVIELEPNNNLAKSKIKECLTMIVEDSEKEKNLYARMIGAIK